MADLAMSRLQLGFWSLGIKFCDAGGSFLRQLFFGDEINSLRNVMIHRKHHDHYDVPDTCLAT